MMIGLIGSVSFMKYSGCGQNIELRRSPPLEYQVTIQDLQYLIRHPFKKGSLRLWPRFANGVGAKKVAIGAPSSEAPGLHLSL